MTKTISGGKWWEKDEHKLNMFQARYCSCPYHQKLRDDAEDDRRDERKWRRMMTNSGFPIFRVKQCTARILHGKNEGKICDNIAKYIIQGQSRNGRPKPIYPTPEPRYRCGHHAKGYDKEVI